MKRRSFFARVFGLAAASAAVPTTKLDAKQWATEFFARRPFGDRIALIEERQWTVNELRVWYGLPPLPDQKGN